MRAGSNSTTVLNMLKRLDKIRFRGQRPDVFLDLGESPSTSDTECSEEILMKPKPLLKIKDTEELQDSAGLGTLAMAAAIQDYQRTETDGLNEVKGHLEIALLEKHFLREYFTLFQSRFKEKFVKPLAQKETMYSWLQTWLYDRFGAYIEDFRFQPEVNTAEPDEPLSAKRLTENMRRLKRGAKPVTNFKRNLFALSSWHSVYTSTFAFIIYMNAAWHGWAIPLFLFLDPPKEDLTVSEKFQLVLDVAQKAQVIYLRLLTNMFHTLYPCLSLCFSLFMWVHPEITQKLYIGLWVAFICSCLLPYKLMGFMMGLYAGIKFFIIDFLFRSCPKLREKYDTPHIIWTSLPTDPQLKERGGATLSRRIQPAVARGSLGTGLACGISLEEQTGRVYNTKKGSFHEVFNLSEDERPLAVCENGWRCCLINRDRKSPTDYIRNGVLFVTENYLCFESSSSRSNSSKKNKVIKLIDITDIQKYKVLSVLPGSGMGISIATPSTQKPLVFGAMIHRDEAFDAIFTQYMKTATMTTAINPET
uniref:GRAM domain containing 4 n=1 Tax=Salmo trutta TaxID=8032 RepID=A0A673ZRX7_SALTR